VPKLIEVVPSVPNVVSTTSFADPTEVHTANKISAVMTIKSLLTGKSLAFIRHPWDSDDLPARKGDRLKTAKNKVALPYIIKWPGR
jgi:hypothetical protein